MIFTFDTDIERVRSGNGLSSLEEFGSLCSDELMIFRKHPAVLRIGDLRISSDLEYITVRKCDLHRNSRLRICHRSDQYEDRSNDGQP